MTASEGHKLTLPTLAGRPIAETYGREAVTRMWVSYDWHRVVSSGLGSPCMHSAGDISVCVVLFRHCVMRYYSTCPAALKCARPRRRSGIGHAQDTGAICL